MKLLQILLITLTAITGCTKKTETKPVYNPPANTNIDTVVKATNKDTITYLALGDSYTIGEAEPLAQSFPYQLTASLKQGGFNTTDPKIIAVTGWTTSNLINAIASSDILNKKYSVVTLLIGVNDQYQGLSQDSYRTNFVALLNTAINFADGDKTRVFVLSIPDYGVTPFAAGQDAVIGPLIDQFNAINQNESGKASVNYLNITEISRAAATNSALIAPDGLHPSDKMYKLWIDKLEPIVGARLNKGS